MMEMRLKNYTTSVNADKSILEIEKFLTMFGASHVMKEYLSDGLVRTLSFKISGRGYKVPANVDGVEKVMFTRGASTQKQHEQAYRVAWRIIRDWVHSQLSITVSGQAQPDEVLLPYLWDGKKTLYEAYKEGALQIENQSVDVRSTNQ